MALNKIDVPISLTLGIDTKTDPKQVVIGKLLSLQNSRYKTLNSFIKRNGYDALSASILGGGSISNGIGLESFQNQLTLIDGNSFYSFNEATLNWSNKGALTNVGVKATPVVNNANSQSSPDSAYNSAGLTAHVWEDSSGGVRYSITDTISGNPIVSNQLVSSSGSSPRVASIGSFLVICYVDLAQIQYRSISTSTPNILSVATPITTDLNITHTNFDIKTIGSKLFIAYSNTSPAIAFYSLSTLLVLSSQYTVGSDFATCINIYGDASNNVWASYYTGTAVRTLIVNNALNTNVLSPTTVETIANIVNVTGATISSTADVLYEVSATANSTSIITVANYNTETTYIPLIGSGHWADQPFSPNATGTLTSANVDVYQNFTAGTYTGFYNVEVWSDNSGQPFQILATSNNITVSGALNAAPGTFTTATFTSGPTLIAGAQYHLVIDTSNLVLATGSYFAQVGTGQPAASGMHSLFTANSGSTWNTHQSGGQPDTFIFNVQESVTTTASFPTNDNIRINTITSAGVVGAPNVLIRSLGLASKAFVQSNVIYVLGAYQSNLQGKYFVLNTSGAAVARIAGEVTNVGAGLLTDGLLPSVISPISGVYQIDNLQLHTPTFTAPLTFGGQAVESALSGVYTATVDFTVNPIASLTLGNTLNITGGLPDIYDGNNIVEQGFNLYPENIINTFFPIGGGLSPSQYQYQVTYEWVDNQGQTNRSAPSTGIEVDLDPATNQTSFILSATLNSNNVLDVAATYNISVGSSVIGANIPAGTIVTYVGGSGTNIYLSQNATSSTTEIIQIIPQYQITGSTKAGSEALVVGQAPFVQVVGLNINTSSPIVTVNTTAGLQVGMIVDSGSGLVSGYVPFPLSFGTFITSINSSNNTITLSNNPIVNTTNAVLMCWLGFECKSNGTTTLDNIPSQYFSELFVGQNVWPLGFSSAPVQIVSLSPGSPGSITVSATTFSSSFFQYFPIGLNGTVPLQVGMTIADTSSGSVLTTPTIITAINNTTSTVTLSTPALSTQSNVTFNIASVFSNALTVPTLRVTNKSTPINITVYRTIGNGTVLFKIGTVQNNPFLDSVNFYDTLSDYQITANNQIYTTGNVVDNICAPASSLITTYNNRQILVPSESPLKFWFSQQVVPGTPVEFSDILINNIDQRGGDITAVGVMDDKLIMFKQNNLLYLVGQGPDFAGNSSDYNSGTLIVSPVGCTNQKSLVQMPNGLMFQASSNNGIWLLTRDLGVQYIGADVEAFNSSTVTSAQLIPNATEVRFTLSNNTILVYDYYVGKWDIDTNLSGTDSCLFQNQFTFLNSNGTVLQEAPGTYTDNGNAINQGYTTSWLSFAGLQGYQRVYELDLLGQWYSSHNLIVQFAYNFNSSITQTSTIPVSTSTNPYQFRVYLDTQKCEAVQITITEQQTGTFGQGLSLSGLNFIVGKKKGHYKMPAAASYG